MTPKLFVITSGFIGVITGFVTIHSPLVNSWLSIFLWVGVGLVLLYNIPNRKLVLYAGTTFGFFTIASWLISGFKGAQSAIGGFILLTLTLSLLGAVCGLIGSYIFSKIFKKQ